MRDGDEGDTLSGILVELDLEALLEALNLDVAFFSAADGQRQAFVEVVPSVFVTPGTDALA